MKIKDNLIKKCLLGILLSIIAMIIGFFLSEMLLPFQDSHLMTEAELLEAEIEYAVNYPLGIFLLRTGFFVFISCVFFLIVRVLRLIYLKKIKNR